LTYCETEWHALLVAAVVDADDVRRLVLGWPDSVRIEVRRCRCGRDIAAKRGVVAPQGAAKRR
jgi:hypothetical protein